MLKGAISTLQQPREQGPLAEEEGRNGMDGQAVFGQASTGQQGQQQAHCASKSALALLTLTVQLGLPRCCLTTSGSAEVSEGAGAGTDMSMCFCLVLGVWTP